MITSQNSGKPQLDSKAALRRLQTHLIVDAPDSVSTRQRNQRRGMNRNTAWGRAMSTCGNAVDSYGAKIRCGKAACPACGPRAANRHARRTTTPMALLAQEIGGTFWHLTLIYEPTDDISTVGDIAKSRKRALRNRIADLIARRPEYDGMFVVGALEVDLIRDNQFDLLGGAKQRTLGHLGFPHDTCGGPVWLPHTHALVWLPPGCNPNVLREQLSRSFGAPGQIKLQQVSDDERLEHQVRKIARYPFKNRCRLALPDDVPAMLWDAEEIALYLDWANRFSSRGARAFRFGIGKSRLIQRAMLLIEQKERAASGMNVDESAFGGDDDDAAGGDDDDAAGGDDDDAAGGDDDDVEVTEHRGQSTLRCESMSSKGGTSSTTSARAGCADAHMHAPSSAEPGRHWSSKACREPEVRTRDDLIRHLRRPRSAATPSDIAADGDNDAVGCH